MKVHLIAVGKLKESFWTAAVEEYKKRISRFGELIITEINEAKNDRPLETEGKEILKKTRGFVIVLDIHGKLLSSEEFAEIIQEKLVGGISEFSFVIGSSEGLSDEVKGKADLLISFGRFTYPHQLMRVIFSEQLYRAVTIINGITYHK